MSFWVIVALFVAGTALLVVELFTPGLVVGAFGAACLGAAVYGLYTAYGVAAGTGGLVLAVGIGGGIGLFALRRLTLRGTQPAGGAADPSLAALRGREGVARTPLRPSGFAEIDGRQVDVTSRGEPIDAGAAVRVVEVEGDRVVVSAVR